MAKASRRAPPKKKKPVRLGPRSIDEKYVGPEPAEGVDYSDPTEDVAKATHWYAYFNDVKKSRDWAVEWYSSLGRKDVVANLKAVTNKGYTSIVPIGWYSKLLLRKSKLSDDAANLVTALEERLAKVVEEESKAEPTKQPTRVIKRQSVGEWLVRHLEDVVDSDEFPEINVVALVAKAANETGNLTGAKADDYSFVARHFEPLANELSELCALVPKKIEAQTKKRDETLVKLDRAYDAKKLNEPRIAKLVAEIDEFDDASIQLLEAYEGTSRRQRIALRDFVVGIVSAFDFQIKAEKAEKASTRKPRVAKAKAVDATKMTKNMKLKLSDEDLKIASKPAKDVVGAKVVWSYNAKTRRLCVWESDDGFVVSGSTLKGLTKSRGKIVRKPEEVIPVVASAPPKKKFKLFDDVRTKEHEPPARTSEDTLILAIER